LHSHVFILFFRNPPKIPDNKDEYNIEPLLNISENIQIFLGRKSVKNLKKSLVDFDINNCRINIHVFKCIAECTSLEILNRNKNREIEVDIAVNLSRLKTETKKDYENI
jgi:hypothetical protein